MHLSQNFFNSDSRDIIQQSQQKKYEQLQEEHRIQKNHAVQFQNFSDIFNMNQDSSQYNIFGRNQTEYESFNQEDLQNSINLQGYSQMVLNTIANQINFQENNQSNYDSQTQPFLHDQQELRDPNLNFFIDIQKRVMPMMGNLEEEPKYVNEKQYNRMMIMRLKKAKELALKNLNGEINQSKSKKIGKKEKNYKYESRHIHAVKRERGPDGRFGKKKDIQQTPNIQTNVNIENSILKNIKEIQNNLKLQKSETIKNEDNSLENNI